MRVLLDTVAFILAAANPESIPTRARTVLLNANTMRELSIVTLVEIAIKQNKGKLAFPKDKVISALGDLKLHILPYSADHAFNLFNLPLHHTDPFDRQLIAQALAEDIPILTSDEKFRLYDGIQVIW